MTISTWPPRFEELLRSHLPLLDPEQSLTPDAPLVDLGLDSMGAVALLVELESAFRILVPDELLTARTFASPGSLWAAIARVGAR